MFWETLSRPTARSSASAENLTSREIKQENVGGQPRTQLIALAELIGWAETQLG